MTAVRSMESNTLLSWWHGQVAKTSDFLSDNMGSTPIATTIKTYRKFFKERMVKNFGKEIRYFR